MIKKMFGVFTSIVAALVVVGVAWAGTDDVASTSVAAEGEASTQVSMDDFSSSTDAAAASSTDATAASSHGARVQSSTSATVDASTAVNVEDDDDSSTTSTSIASTTSTSTNANSSTSTTVDSTTSTTVEDDDDQAPEGVSTHIIPGVGTVTVEVDAGQLILVSVSAPGFSVEHHRIEPDRIELRFSSGLTAEAEFDARLNNGRVEIETEVDLG